MHEENKPGYEGVLVSKANWKRVLAAVDTIEGLNLHANLAGLGRRITALEAERGQYSVLGLADRIQDVESKLDWTQTASGEGDQTNRNDITSMKGDLAELAAMLEAFKREIRAIEKRSSTALWEAGVVKDQLMLDRGEVEPPWLDDGEDEDEGTFADWIMAQLAKIDTRFSVLEKTARPAVALRRLNDVDARLEELEAYRKDFENRWSATVTDLKAARSAHFRRIVQLEDGMSEHGNRLNALQNYPRRIPHLERNAIERAVDRVRVYMDPHFSTATIEGVIAAIQGEVARKPGDGDASAP